MKEKTRKIFFNSILFLLALLFVAKFGGSTLLKQYIKLGFGNCQKIPILCMIPSEEIINPTINKEYIAELLSYRLPKMAISTPKDMTVIKEKIKKAYYKKKRKGLSGGVIYLLQEEPYFFMNLFPQLKKQGIQDDYGFIKRVMSTRLEEIKNLDDAFFVIIKGIFIPDLGDQNNLKMSQFIIADKRGFINYNLGKDDNYFDCNIIDEQGNLFKVYIKDKGAKLDLDKVMAIISTVKKLE